MNTNTFIMLFAIYSIATGLVVEAIKKLLDEANRKYASNLLAFIVAIVIGTAGTLVYYQLYGIAFDSKQYYLCSATRDLSGVGAMVGFDKVKQFIGQIK